MNRRNILRVREAGRPIALDSKMIKKRMHELYGGCVQSKIAPKLAEGHIHRTLVARTALARLPFSPTPFDAHIDSGVESIPTILYVACGQVAPAEREVPSATKQTLSARSIAHTCEC